MQTAAELLREGIRLSHEGQRRRAAQLLVALLQQNPTCEAAWLELVKCVDTPQQKRDCLERALQANPNNEQARTWLTALEESMAAATLKTQPLRLHATTAGLLTEGEKAELAGYFASAYDKYSQTLVLNEEESPAWLGKGFCAGMLSTPSKNRVREFADCLNRCLLSGDRKKLNHKEALRWLEPDLRLRMLERISTLSAYIDQLVDRCEMGMANIFTIERVCLADWTYFLSDSPSRMEDLKEVVEYSFARITERIVRSTRGARARRELIETYRGFLLSNLEFSGLQKDPQLTGLLEEMVQPYL